MTFFLWQENPFFLQNDFSFFFCKIRAWEAYYTEKTSFALFVKKLVFFHVLPNTSKKTTLYRNEINTLPFFTTTLYGKTFVKYLRLFFISKKSVSHNLGGFIFQPTQIFFLTMWNVLGGKHCSCFLLVSFCSCPRLFVFVWLLFLTRSLSLMSLS